MAYRYQCDYQITDRGEPKVGCYGALEAETNRNSPEPIDFSPREEWHTQDAKPQTDRLGRKLWRPLELQRLTTPKFERVCQSILDEDEAIGGI